MEAGGEMGYDVNNRKKGGKIYEEENGEKADLSITCLCNGSFHARSLRKRIR